MVVKSSFQDYKRSMNTHETIVTRRTRSELSKAKALDDAAYVRTLFGRAAVMAELLGIMSYNAFKTGPDNILDGPISINNLDVDTLASHKLLGNKGHYQGKKLKNTLPALTNRGLVAMNMVQLDEMALNNGALEAYLTEPFEGLDVLVGRELAKR